MKKVVLFIASLLLLSGYSLSAYAQSDADAMKAAQNDLQMMLNQIPVGQLEGFGFHSRAEFSIATIGKPYRMLGLSDEFYKGSMPWRVSAITNGKNDRTFNNSVLVVQNQWRVPVIVNGEQRMLLTVSYKDGTYETVDMGASGLAAELQGKSKASDPNNNYYLLRIYPLEADFFVEVTGTVFQEAKFTPLYAATMSMPVLSEMGATPLTVFDIMPVIKDALKNHQNN